VNVKRTLQLRRELRVSRRAQEAAEAH